jgi:hypothetical protein
MSRPEDALEQARAAAAEMRAAGAYGEARPSLPGPPPPELVDLKLYQWAFIEPDLRQVRSTRRFGAPLTAVKRALLRLLIQYHVQLIGEQTRFNAVMVGYVHRLEARIAELEEELAREGREP